MPIFRFKLSQTAAQFSCEYLGHLVGSLAHCYLLPIPADGGYGLFSETCFLWEDHSRWAALIGRAANVLFLSETLTKVSVPCRQSWRCGGDMGSPP